MREQKTIRLAKPLTTHEGPISEIVIREPSFDEYLTFGDPWTVAATGSDERTAFAVENIEVIKQYLQVCLVKPQDPALLSQAGARVAKDVKEALLGFFRPDAAAGEGSAT